MNKILKTYPLTDIISGNFDPLTLEEEIVASGHVTDYATLTFNSENVNVWGDSISNESGLDSVIANHDQTSEIGLSTKEKRDLYIIDELPNWGNLSDDRKKRLVKYFVYPESATESELNALYPNEERDSYMSRTILAIVVDTPVVKVDSGQVRYFMQTADSQGVLGTEELKSYEVF